MAPSKMKALKGGKTKREYTEYAELWETIKGATNIKKEQSEEIFEKIMAENVPKLMSETQSQVHKAHRTPMQSMPQNLCVNILLSSYRTENQRQRTLQEEEEEKRKNTSFTQTRVKITSDSSEIMEVRRKGVK